MQYLITRPEKIISKRDPSNSTFDLHIFFKLETYYVHSLFHLPLSTYRHWRRLHKLIKYIMHYSSARHFTAHTFYVCYLESQMQHCTFIRNHMHTYAYKSDRFNSLWMMSEIINFTEECVERRWRFYVSRRVCRNII